MSTQAVKSPTQKKEDRNRLIFIGVGGIALLGVGILLSTFSTRPEPITDPTYYRGPIYNHEGELVGPDGKIVPGKKLKVKSRGNAPG